MSLALQWWIVALLVGLAAVYAFRRLWPNASFRLERRFVLWLLRAERTPRLRAIGLRLAPAYRSQAAQDCGSCKTGCQSPS